MAEVGIGFVQSVANIPLEQPPLCVIGIVDPTFGEHGHLGQRAHSNIGAGFITTIISS